MFLVMQVGGTFDFAIRLMCAFLIPEDFRDVSKRTAIAWYSNYGDGLSLEEWRAIRLG